MAQYLVPIDAKIKNLKIEIKRLHFALTNTLSKLKIKSEIKVEENLEDDKPYVVVDIKDYGITITITHRLTTTALSLSGKEETEWIFYIVEGQIPEYNYPHEPDSIRDEVLATVTNRWQAIKAVIEPIRRMEEGSIMESVDEMMDKQGFYKEITD